MVYWNSLVSPVLLWEMYTYPYFTNSNLNRAAFTAKHDCKDNFFIEIFSLVTAHHFFVCSQCSSSASTANPLGQKWPHIFIYTYMYMHTGVYIWHVYIQDTPLFPLKWWPAGTTEAWAQPLHILHGKQGPPGDLSLTSRSSSHFGAQLAMWDGAHHYPDQSAGKLKHDVRYINNPCCVLSTSILDPITKATRTSWNLFGHRLRSFSSPLDSAFPPTQPQLTPQCFLVAGPWRNSNLPPKPRQIKDSNFSANTIKVSPKWLSSPNVYLDK